MNLIDPNLIFIGTFLAPIVTEIATQFDAGAKVKQWVATVLTALIVIGSIVTHARMGDISFDAASDAYAFVAFLVSQFGIVRASVEGGHRGFDLAERATGRSMSATLLPNAGFGGGDGPKSA